MRRLIVVPLLLLVTRCVGPVEPLRLELGRLEVPAVVEVGVVQAGEPREVTFTVSNPGPGPLFFREARLEPGAANDTYVFDVGALPDWLLAGESVEVPVRFTTVGEAGVVTARLAIFTNTDDPEQPGTKQQAEVLLRAEGLRYGLAVSPLPVDLGTVPAGVVGTQVITVTNRLDRPVTVYAPDHEDGRVYFLGVEGEGRFEVAEPVETWGRVPAGNAELGPGASLRLTLTYQAPAVPLGDGGRATFRLAGCSNLTCAQPVPVLASTDNDALVCAPERVDFGRVYPGESQAREVTCASRAAVPLEVIVAEVAVGGAPELWAGAPSAAWVTPGGTIRIPVHFSPTQDTLLRGGTAEGIFTLLARDPVSGGVARSEVSLVGQVGGARLVVRPNPLDFGEVALDTYLVQRLELENIGFDPLQIRQIVPDLAGTGAFDADTSPITLQPGEVVELEVRFAPRVPGTIRSQIRFVSNDAAEPTQDVDMIGNGLDLPPCRYGLEPPELNFGSVFVEQSAQQHLVVRNVDRGDCLVRQVRIEPAAGTAEGVFSLTSPVSDPLVLGPGQVLDLGVAFTPDQAGGAQAWLTFYVSDPQNPAPRIPLRGVGRPLLEVICPPDVTTPAGDPVVLALHADGIGTVVAYDWSIVSAPAGGIGTPDQWSPAPPTSATEAFLPFIVGVYTLQATVTDDQGRQAACTTEVTAEGRGLRVTLTWDGPGDVDLHVRRRMTMPWFTDDDCYYANRTPEWDPSWPRSEGPNPELDFDNTTANGPENTRINVVVVGEEYTIGAHNFGRAQGRRATIQIFCGGGTVADATFTSRPLQGNDGGTCTANDFWKVATVVFENQSVCRITHLDEYPTSQEMCSHF